MSLVSTDRKQSRNHFALSATKRLQRSITHWDRVTHICVSKPTTIGSDNDLSPGRRQAIIWTKAGILLIGPLGINFRDILSEIHTFSPKKMRLKTPSAKWWPSCLGLESMFLSSGYHPTRTNLGSGSSQNMTDGRLVICHRLPVVIPINTVTICSAKETSKSYLLTYLMAYII